MLCLLVLYTIKRDTTLECALHQNTHTKKQQQEHTQEDKNSATHIRIYSSGNTHKKTKKQQHTQKNTTPATQRLEDSISKTQEKLQQ